MATDWQAAKFRSGFFDVFTGQSSPYKTNVEEYQTALNNFDQSLYNLLDDDSFKDKYSEVYNTIEEDPNQIDHIYPMFVNLAMNEMRIGKYESKEDFYNKNPWFKKLASLAATKRKIEIEENKYSDWRLDQIKKEPREYIDYSDQKKSEVTPGDVDKYKFQKQQMAAIQGFFNQWLTKVEEQGTTMNRIIKLLEKQFFEFDPNDKKMLDTMEKYRDSTNEKFNNQRRLNALNLYEGKRQLLRSGGQNTQLWAKAMKDTKTTEFIYDKIMHAYDVALDPNADYTSRRGAAQFIGEGLLTSKYTEQKMSAMQSIAGIGGTLPQYLGALSPLVQLYSGMMGGGEQTVNPNLQHAVQMFMGMSPKEREEFKENYPDMHDAIINAISSTGGKGGFGSGNLNEILFSSINTQ